MSPFRGGHLVLGRAAVPHACIPNQIAWGHVLAVLRIPVSC